MGIAAYNRRLHALADWLGLALATLGDLFATGEAFVLDSLPLPQGAGAGGLRLLRREAEKFFGWRLHLVVTPQGVPVTFTASQGDDVVCDWYNITEADDDGDDTGGTSGGTTLPTTGIGRDHEGAPWLGAAALGGAAAFLLIMSLCFATE